MVNPKRTRILKNGKLTQGAIAYWMSRDQRVRDNWSLLFAQEEALRRNKPLIVLFCLVQDFLGATERQYAFMLKGIKEVEQDLVKLNIPFFVLFGSPDEVIPDFVKRFNISMLITDFDPLRIKRRWKDGVSAGIDVSFIEVDSHNIVPCWVASPKQEYGAYTIRPKIHRLLGEFVEDFPEVISHPITYAEKISGTDWDKIIKKLNILGYMKKADIFTPGEKAARLLLDTFVMDKIGIYDSKRNDPNSDCQSNLSPYLHFGQISAQRVLIEVNKIFEHRESAKGFLEELIVRRELSDNFCFYNNNYDNFDGFPEWSKKTLNEHRRDIKRYLYTTEEFENGQTHDELWNAAQIEMVKTGKMHGFMRMYWAKKILEWSESPEEAISNAIYLNDRYELDGRDPNGYAGIAWSIGGVHDRAWQERNIFGKIRYMSYNGCRSKFNVRAYIDKVASL